MKEIRNETVGIQCRNEECDEYGCWQDIPIKKVRTDDWTNKPYVHCMECGRIVEIEE